MAGGRTESPRDRRGERADCRGCDGTQTVTFQERVVRGSGVTRPAPQQRRRVWFDDSRTHDPHRLLRLALASAPPQLVELSRGLGSLPGEPRSLRLRTLVVPGLQERVLPAQPQIAVETRRFKLASFGRGHDRAAWFGPVRAVTEAARDRERLHVSECLLQPSLSVPELQLAHAG